MDWTRSQCTRMTMNGWLMRCDWYAIFIKVFGCKRGKQSCWPGYFQETMSKHELFIIHSRNNSEWRPFCFRIQNHLHLPINFIPTLLNIFHWTPSFQCIFLSVGIIVNHPVRYLLIVHETGRICVKPHHTEAFSEVDWFSVNVTWLSVLSFTVKFNSKSNVLKRRLWVCDASTSWYKSSWCTESARVMRLVSKFKICWTVPYLGPPHPRMWVPYSNHSVCWRICGCVCLSICQSTISFPDDSLSSAWWNLLKLCRYICHHVRKNPNVFFAS
jgi:hypothetical protein